VRESRADLLALHGRQEGADVGAGVLVRNSRCNKIWVDTAGL
jgi:hypothetical protein